MNIREAMMDYNTSIFLPADDIKLAARKCVKIAREFSVSTDIYLWENRELEKYDLDEQKEPRYLGVYSSLSEIRRELERSYSDAYKVVICLEYSREWKKQPEILEEEKDEIKEDEDRLIIFIEGEDAKVPEKWKNDLNLAELQVDENEIKEYLVDDIKEYFADDECNDETIDESDIKKAVEVMQGLKVSDMKKALYTSIEEKGVVNFNFIFKFKADFFCKEGLEFVDNSEKIEVGGMLSLKKYISKKIVAYSDEEAKKYGLSKPGGILLRGINGTGKGLVAKYIASIITFPIVKIDEIKILEESQERAELDIKNILKNVEEMSPCVFLIKDIDKILEKSLRITEDLLNWVENNHTKDVFVIATAESNRDLPIKRLYKGGFDKMFYLDLPNKEEVMEIIKIVIRKINRNPEDFNIKNLSEKFYGFTGKEIEQIIRDSLFDSYADGARELRDEDIISNIKDKNFYSRDLFSNELEIMRNWEKKYRITRA